MRFDVCNGSEFKDPAIILLMMPNLSTEARAP